MVFSVYLHPHYAYRSFCVFQKSTFMEGIWCELKRGMKCRNEKEREWRESMYKRLVKRIVQLIICELHKKIMVLDSMLMPCSLSCTRSDDT